MKFVQHDIRVGTATHNMSTGNHVRTESPDVRLSCAGLLGAVPEHKVGCRTEFHERCTVCRDTQNEMCCLQCDVRFYVGVGLSVLSQFRKIEENEH